MAQYDDAKNNRLLAALTDADWQRWRSLLQCVDLTRGQVLYEAGRPPRYAYFPTTALVSLLRGCTCGLSTEVAVVGNESVVGTSLLLSARGSTDASAVLIAGQAFRIGAKAIQDEFIRFEAVRGLLLRYIQALATQIAQNVVCYRHHTIEQQVCGWLLHVQDRLQGSGVVVTQEFIASMLSVRRESVTTAVGKLQEAGLIHCARGLIVVHDPVGLARRSCECHGVVKKEYERLLPQSTPSSDAVPSRATWRLPQSPPPQRRPAQLRGIAPAHEAPTESHGARARHLASDSQSVDFAL